MPAAKTMLILKQNRRSRAPWRAGAVLPALLVVAGTLALSIAVAVVSAQIAQASL